MKQFAIYGIGAALVDTEITTTAEALQHAGIEKGVMTLVDEPRQAEILATLLAGKPACKRASGGSACNTVVAASYFGAKCYFSGRVANDENGEFFVQDLHSANVGYSDQALPPGHTGKCLVMITPDADRTMNTFLGANDDLTNTDINLAAIADSEILYLEGYLVTSENRKNVAIAAKHYAQKHGVKTALSLSDPAMVQFFGDAMKDIIGDGVDILFCNEEEALNYTKTDNLEAACDVLATIAKLCVVTRGAHGARIIEGNIVIDSEGVTVTAIDTNGAGDMYAGAFLYALSAGHTRHQAAYFANHAAAAVVQQYGPRLNKADHQRLLSTLHSSE